jgi:hypothetical protein
LREIANCSVTYLDLGRFQVPKNILKNTAVTVVLDLIGRIDPAQQRNIFA